MAESLRRRNFNGEAQTKCMPNILHYIDLHQHLHVRKRIAHRSHADSSVKVPKVEEDNSSTSGKHENLDKNAKSLVKRKGNKASNVFPKFHLRNIITKKRSHEKHQSGKISPSTSQLLRTMSIHHMDSYKYVPDDDATSCNDNLSTEIDSSEEESSSESIPASPGTFGIPVVEKHVEVSVDKKNMDGHQDFAEPRVLENQSAERHDFAEPQVVHNQTTEHHQVVEPQVVEDQITVTVNKLNQQKETIFRQNATSSRDLGRSVSLFKSKEFINLMGLLSANKELLLQILQDPSFFENYAQTSTLAEEPSAGVVRTQENMDPMRLRTDSLRKKEKGLLVDNSSSSSSIFKDGVQTVEPLTVRDDNISISENTTAEDSQHCTSHQNRIKSKHLLTLKEKIKHLIRENKKENQKKISIDGFLHKIPNGLNYSNSMKREIQAPWAKNDIYNSKGKFRKIGGSSNSSKYAFQSMGKSSSFTESLERYAPLLESLTSTKPRSADIPSLSTELNDIQSRKPSKRLERIISLPEIRLLSSGENIQKKPYDDRQSVMLPTSRISADKTLMREPSTLSQEEQISDKHREGKETSQIFKEQNDTTARTQVDELSLSNNFEEPEPCKTRLLTQQDDTVANPYLEENYPGSLTEVCSEGLKLQQLRGHFQESAPFLDLDNVEEDPDRTPTSSKTSDFHIQVDEENEAEFEYVREILYKSGFISEEAFGEWFLPNQPMDPSLFEETECYSYDVNFLGNEPDTTTLNHMLLFDLINEVLIDIYNTSYASCPWVPHSGSHIRPVPIGYHVLEEVWSVISRHLHSQLLLDQTVEGIVSRDFMKNDGWMHIQHDTEEIGLELEVLIFYDLIDEVF